jgi:hypothetical protein
MAWVRCSRSHLKICVDSRRGMELNVSVVGSSIRSPDRLAVRYFASSHNPLKGGKCYDPQ